MLDRCSHLFRGLFRGKTFEKPGTPRVLAIMKEGPTRLLVENISKELGWTVLFSDEGSAVERVALAPIILYEQDPSSFGWPLVVRGLTKRMPRPYLILLSPQVSLNLWDELQRNGGSDILRLPVRNEAVVNAVERAWRLWTNEESLRQPVLHS